MREIPRIVRGNAFRLRVALFSEKSGERLPLLVDESWKVRLMGTAGRFAFDVVAVGNTLTADIPARVLPVGEFCVECFSPTVRWAEENVLQVVEWSKDGFLPGADDTMEVETIELSGVVDAMTDSVITDLPDLSVGTSKLVDSAVTMEKLAEQVRSLLHLANTALQVHQRLKTINGESLAGEGNIVLQTELGDGSVGTSKLADGAVTMDKLADDVIELHERLANLDHELFEVVTELPTSNINPNKIYVLPNRGDIEFGDIYMEYMYVNGLWELIGKHKPDTTLGEGSITDAMLHDRYIKQEVGAVQDRMLASRFMKPSDYNTVEMVVTYEDESVEVFDILTLKRGV